jgi:hypothetical protein
MHQTRKVILVGQETWPWQLATLSGDVANQKCVCWMRNDGAETMMKPAKLSHGGTRIENAPAK